MNDRYRRAHSIGALAAGVALVVTLAGGCASLPSSGTPQGVAVPPPQGGGVSQCCRMLVKPPQPDWGPAEVVSNFLLASTSAADNYRIARMYLTESASDTWRPGPQPQVIILSGTPTVYQVPVHAGAGSAQVVASGQELATLNSSGQYIQAPSGAPPPRQVFTLQNVNGEEKIASLPGSSPRYVSTQLINSALFHLVYTPRNLYYYGLRDNALLPDPVYVPIQGANLVDTLVHALLHNPTGSLAGAARTYFPPGAHLAGVQVFPSPTGGSTATVNIALPQHASAEILRTMAIPLICTLTSPVFRPALFRAVRVKFNGRPWPARGPAQNLASYQNVIPHWRSDMNVYYLAQDGSVRSLAAKSSHAATLSGGVAASLPPLSQVAVSPDGTHLAGLTGPANAVYTGSIGGSARPGSLHEPPSGASFTSLSWDSANDLWVAGRLHNSAAIWVLRNGQGPAVQVSPLPLPGPVTSLRVAPDGVRVAMIVGRTAQVWLAAIVSDPAGGFSITQPVPLGGQGLTRVSALTWYDEDHLLAVAGPPSATQLWEVPADGESATALTPKEAGMTSVTAAGSTNPFYLGFASGQLDRAKGLNQLLNPIAAGHAPAYPG